MDYNLFSFNSKCMWITAYSKRGRKLLLLRNLILKFSCLRNMRVLSPDVTKTSTPVGSVRTLCQKTFAKLKSNRGAEIDIRGQINMKNLQTDAWEAVVPWEGVTQLQVAWFRVCFDAELMHPLTHSAWESIADLLGSECSVRLHSPMES